MQIRKAIKQLNNQQTGLRHLVSDLSLIRITMTAAAKHHICLNQQWQLLDQVVAVVLDDKHLHYQQWQLLDQVVAVVWVTNTYIIDNGSSWTKW
ncbi:hypothetical protein ACOMHN_023016 [Nucella lapillus]